jgi:hypothetical protein
MLKIASVCLVFALTISAVPIQAQNGTPPKPPDLLKALQYRSIGPYRGGRSAAVAGVPSQPFVFYYGATGGGVWKTTDGGISWESYRENSDKGTSSDGAIAVAVSDPNVVFVGGGGARLPRFYIAVHQGRPAF